MFGDGVGEAPAFLLAPADEPLEEAQAAVRLLFDGGEAGSEHDIAGSDRQSAGGGEERAAVRERIFGVAEHEVERKRAAERIAGRLGMH